MMKMGIGINNKRKEEIRGGVCPRSMSVGKYRIKISDAEAPS